MSAEARRLLSSAEIAGIVGRLGREISAAHPGGVVLVGVLKGSVCFMADLLRQVSVDCEVDFLALSAYASGPTRVQVLKDLDIDVAGREVVLVEDIVDTGLSARYVLGLLAGHGAREVRLCALLDRPARRILPLAVDFLGMEAPDDFLVGYGLDLAERYRNLPDVVAIGDAPTGQDAAELERSLYGAPDVADGAPRRCPAELHRE